MSINTITDFLLAYAYYYPLFMSYLWMCGALYYRFHWERTGGRRYDNPPPLAECPPVTVLIPCFNEAARLKETVSYAFQQDYPEFEVLVVNDGSTDNTAEVLNELQIQYPKLRTVHLEHNRGKAMALRTGALMSATDYLVCIDADAVLDRHAIRWMIPHFLQSARVAAVTGNPRIRNRSTLLGKIQVGEFSSIIGMIKRAQRIYGRIFTVSGVVTTFRKSALQQVGFWSTDNVTDDIDVSWRLQIDHWDIRYEPNALCWILMPETYSGLWRQRLRWAQGGVETALRYGGELFSWRKRRMWMVLLEYLLSVTWSYILFTIIVLWLLGKLVTLPEYLQVPSIIPSWNGVVLGMTCLLQFFVSLLIDSRYEKGLLRNFYWMIWYPLAYWLINVLTAVVAVPSALFKGQGRTGRWSSPDRGLQDQEQSKVAGTAKDKTHES